VTAGEVVEAAFAVVLSLVVGVFGVSFVIRSIRALFSGAEA